MCCKAKTENELNYENDYIGNNYDYNNNKFNDFFADNINDKENEVSNAKANVKNISPRYLLEMNDDNNDNISVPNNKPNNIINEITSSELNKNKMYDNKNKPIFDDNKHSSNSKLSFSNINVAANNNNTIASTFGKGINNKSNQNNVVSNENNDKEIGQSINSQNIKYLKLTIQESKFNQVNHILKINNFGLEGSTRPNKDGSVYFGQKGEFNNDFILQQEEGLNSRHFEIKYENTLNDYFIKNIKESGVFIKINEPIALRHGMVISFGSNHVLVNISEENDQRDNESTISFKGLYGVNKGQYL